VTAWYRMSLKHWRTHQPDGFLHTPHALTLLLSVGARLLVAMCRLADAHVVHYDIKCDNILLVADRAVTDAHLLDHRGRAAPSFDLVVTDFGESKLYSATQEGYTTRNRGTEYIKSPEMLTVANASSKERATYDRRKKMGANKASDVWGAACVLYEVLTGDYLFFDEDWIRFFIRVTGASPEDLIPPERLAPLQQLPGGKHLIDFFKNALIRDPLRRPSMHDLAKRWHVMSAAIAHYLPSADDLVSVAAAASGAGSKEPPSQLHMHLPLHTADTAKEQTGAQVNSIAEIQRSSVSSVSSVPPAPHAAQLSAKRVQRDASRASALLLHEAMTATEVDREMQGKAAVSLGLSGSTHILCGACPQDLEWIDGRQLLCLGQLGVGHLLDCTATAASGANPTHVKLPGTIYSQSALPSLLLGTAASSSSASASQAAASADGLGVGGRGSGMEVRPGASASPLTLQLRQLAKDVAFIDAARRQGSTVLVFDDAGGAACAAGVVIAYLMQVYPPPTPHTHFACVSPTCKHTPPFLLTEQC